MISKIEKYFWICIRFKNWTSSFGFITLKNSKKSSCSCFWSFIINFTASINILPWSSSWGWFIENFTWVWIVWRVSNVVISQMNNLVFWNTILFENLVSMACIRLMSIISIRVWSGNENSPMVWSWGLGSGG